MKKKYNFQQGGFSPLWFTLIELMIVMSIMAILTMAMYTPFAHYQTKQKVRNSAKIITQVLNDSRSKSIYWVLHNNQTLTWNLDIWVKIKTWEDNIKIFWYPYNKTIINYEKPEYLLEEIKLESWVEITWITDWYFIYEAISWSWVYKNLIPDVNNKINLSVWFKWATTWTMIKNIEYYTRTYISDIK